jgi:hypothetical protein
MFIVKVERYLVLTAVLLSIEILLVVMPYRVVNTNKILVNSVVSIFRDRQSKRSILGLTDPADGDNTILQIINYVPLTRFNIAEDLNHYSNTFEVSTINSCSNGIIVVQSDFRVLGFFFKTRRKVLIVEAEFKKKNYRWLLYCVVICLSGPLRCIYIASFGC